MQTHEVLRTRRSKWLNQTLLFPFLVRRFYLKFSTEIKQNSIKGNEFPQFLTGNMEV